MEKDSWRRNHGGGIREEESRRRNHGGGIMREESWRRDHGDFRAAFERHLEASGSIWKHLEGICTQEAPRGTQDAPRDTQRHPEAPRKLVRAPLELFAFVQTT